MLLGAAGQCAEFLTNREYNPALQDCWCLVNSTAQHMACRAPAAGLHCLLVNNAKSCQHRYTLPHLVERKYGACALPSLLSLLWPLLARQSCCQVLLGTQARLQCVLGMEVDC